MNDFEEQLYSFHIDEIQKFITEPCVCRLHQYYFNVNYQNTYDGLSVLMMICKYSHSFDPLKYSYYIPHAMKKIKWLLTVGGANPNIQSKDGYTALMYAAEYSSPRGLSRKRCINKTLQDYKINPIEQKINKHISFMIAASLQKKRKYVKQQSSEKVVRILLEYGANPNIQNEAGCTALMLAAGDSSSERGTSSERMVEILLEDGADPNIQSEYGETALMIAARGSHNGRSSERTVEILLEGGADPDKYNYVYLTAIMLAEDPNTKLLIQKFTK